MSLMNFEILEVSKSNSKHYYKSASESGWYEANTDFLKSQGSFSLFLTGGSLGGGLIIIDKSSSKVYTISDFY